MSIRRLASSLVFPKSTPQYAVACYTTEPIPSVYVGHLPPKFRRDTKKLMKQVVKELKQRPVDPEATMTITQLLKDQQARERFLNLNPENMPVEELLKYIPPEKDYTHQGIVTNTKKEGVVLVSVMKEAPHRLYGGVMRASKLIEVKSDPDNPMRLGDVVQVTSNPDRTTDNIKYAMVRNFGNLYKF